MKRLFFLVTIGIAIMAMGGFFGCSEVDNKVTGDDPADTLGTGTNPPTAQFELAGDMMEFVATSAGQAHLEVAMSLVSELMYVKAPFNGPRLLSPAGRGPSVLLDSVYVDGDWFVCGYTATLTESEDTFSIAGVDSIRFDDGSGGYTTSPDTALTGFDLRSHVEGTVSGAGGTGDIASAGLLDFTGSTGGVMTINAASHDTVSYDDAESGCIYSVAILSDWTNLQFDLGSTGTNDGPSGGGLSVNATIESSCDAGTPDSLQVSGDWTLVMLFGGSTETITIGDGQSEWTFTRDHDGGDPGDSTWPGDTTGDTIIDTTWPGDTTGDTTNPGDTIGDTVVDTTWPGDTIGDTTNPGDTVVDYCQPPYTSQATLDSMKLWAFTDGPIEFTEANIPQVVQLTVEALQTLDTTLAHAFPFASPLLNPQQSSVTWLAAEESYLVIYDMQMVKIDSFYYNDTLEVDTSDIHVAGWDTVQVFDGASATSLPAASIDSIAFKNRFEATFVNNGRDTTTETSWHDMTVTFSSLDSLSTVVINGDGYDFSYVTRYDWYDSVQTWCTAHYSVGVSAHDLTVSQPLFIDMENGDGCPEFGSLNSTVNVLQACVGNWYCDVDITGMWHTSQQFGSSGVNVTIEYSDQGLSWNMVEQCGGPQGSPFELRRAVR